MRVTARRNQNEEASSTATCVGMYWLGTCEPARSCTRVGVSQSTCYCVTLVHRQSQPDYTDPFTESVTSVLQDNEELIETRMIWTEGHFRRMGRDGKSLFNVLMSKLF